MKYAREFVTNATIGGVLVLLPIYLAILLLLKGMQSVVGLVRPLAALLLEWVPAEDLLLVLAVCFLVGVAVRTRAGQAVREGVHPIDVPFTQAVRSVSQWGSGSKDLVAAMSKQDSPARRHAAPAA